MSANSVRPNCRQQRVDARREVLDLRTIVARGLLEVAAHREIGVEGVVPACRRRGRGAPGHRRSRDRGRRCGCCRPRAGGNHSTCGAWWSCPRRWARAAQSPSPARQARSTPPLTMSLPPEVLHESLHLEERAGDRDGEGRRGMGGFRGSGGRGVTWFRSRQSARRHRSPPGRRARQG